MLLLVFLCGIYSNAQDTGVSSLTLVEGTIDTSASSITYELCATTPITLKIVLENFDTDRFYFNAMLILLKVLFIVSN